MSIARIGPLESIARYGDRLKSGYTVRERRHALDSGGDRIDCDARASKRRDNNRIEKMTTTLRDQGLSTEDIRNLANVPRWSAPPNLSKEFFRNVFHGVVITEEDEPPRKGKKPR
jgi:hypothetical protein